MKKNFKSFMIMGLMGFLAAGMTSCSTDEVADLGGSKPLEEDQSFFANVAINSTIVSRAGALGDYTDGDPYDNSKDPNFDEGTEDENKVNSIYLVFYDAAGKRVATTQVRKDLDKFEDPRNASENKIWKGVVQIDLKRNSEKPASVIAFINPITETNFAFNPDFETIAEVEKQTRTDFLTSNSSFAMSTSAYYDLTSGQKVTATPIEEGKLFLTRLEAQDALDADPSASVVDIFVERYAAKVNFTLKEAVNSNSLDTYKDGVAAHKLEFVPEYWTVNAYESETYITKSFFRQDATGAMTSELLSYEGLNGVLDWWWNSPTLSRCYWGQSPAYYAQKYPRVADDILDDLENREDQMSDYIYKDGLGYYSYNEMVDLASGSKGKANAKVRALQGDTDPIYSRENTVAGSALIKAFDDPLASPKAAIASVVMVGHYKLNGQELGEDDVFYIIGNATNGYELLHDGNAAAAYLGENGESTMSVYEYFMNAVHTQITIAKKETVDGKDVYTSVYNYTDDDYGFARPEYQKYFQIVHPNKDVRSTGDTEADKIVLDSRFVTIQLSDEAIEDGLYVCFDGKDYEPITADNVADINRQFFYAGGTVQGFKGGKAFFNIPIKHLGFYRDSNTKNAGMTGVERTFDWKEVKSGDFGLVRNHLYSITVDNIIGLGNGIPDPDDPIVPPTDPEEYYIGARIVVLNWAIVPEQHVTL